MVKAAEVVELETRRDASIEAWLDERKLTYEYNETLPLSRIDRAASLSNQARLEPLDEEVVERYAADMERGDIFPPLVARRSGRKLILIGGNHRTTAATRANLVSFPVYIVDVDAEGATALTYEDNRRHGLPPSEEERLLQAPAPRRHRVVGRQCRFCGRDLGEEARPGDPHRRDGSTCRGCRRNQSSLVEVAEVDTLAPRPDPE